MKGERERGITMGFSLNKVNLLVTSLVCLSVCLSVPSIDSSSDGRWVCC